MGWNPFKEAKEKIGGAFSRISKNPLDLRSYGDLGLATVTGGQVDTHGAGGGSFEDALFGKKTKTKADDIAGVVKAGQLQGMRELNSALNTPSEQIVKQQAETAKKGILTAAQDARRNAQEVMARRGLSNSSLGLAQNRTIDQNAGNQIADVNAKLPGMIRDQRIADAQTRIGQGGLGAQNPIQWNNVTGRGGGMLDLAGQIAPLVGSYYGMQNMAASTKNLNAQSNYLNGFKR